MALTTKCDEDGAAAERWDVHDSEAETVAPYVESTAEASTQARLAFYEMLADDAPCVLFQLERRLGNKQEPTYDFTYASGGVQALLGLSARALEQDALGWLDTVQSCGPHAGRDTFVRALEHSARTLTPLAWQGLVLRGHSAAWIQAQARPKQGSEGRVRWTGVMTDITTHKLNETALENALADAAECSTRERLRAEALMDIHDALVGEQGQRLASHELAVKKEKAAALERLARGLAHEINNPLSGVQHMLEMLRGAPGQRMLDATRRDAYLEQIQSGLSRIEGTVSNLLQYAQAGAPLMRTCDAGAVIDAAVAQVRPAMKLKEVTPEIAALPNDHTLWADQQQLLRALVNVLQNAAHASPRGGTVQVGMDKVPSGVAITVRDHGTGIPSEYLHRVCDPFFTTKQQGDGSGLGLSVAQQITAAHGGELRVETEEGDGTLVTFALPSTPPGTDAT